MTPSSRQEAVSRPRSASSVVVRPATASDLPRTARWQVLHLPHGFFPSLGTRFVRRWHATHLGGRHGVALVAELDAGARGRVPVGFLVGATDQVAHVREVVAHHRGPLALAAALALLRRPRTAARFARTRLRPYARRLLGRDSPGTADDAGAAEGAVAVVAAVVVAPAARGAGVGEALLAAFADAARGAGTEVAELVTRADSGAAAFYERLGWERVRERADRDGVVVLTYRCALAGGPEVAAPAPPRPRRASQQSVQEPVQQSVQEPVQQPVEHRPAAA
ncbi:GNAT family N-acetyltransferase [Pseudokineococcus basanitobsidens]|uniref:GNAT family N-acetyltransferase n=1 Tax=Pseudokineococcus basanitobsidens TaxID=1926649 RepID=A0ABU8RN42_9ACTN